MFVAVAIVESSTCSIQEASYSSACYTHRDQKKRHNEPHPNSNHNPTPPAPKTPLHPKKTVRAQTQTGTSPPLPKKKKNTFLVPRKPQNRRTSNPPPSPFQTKRIPASLTSEPRNPPTLPSYNIASDPNSNLPPLRQQNNPGASEHRNLLDDPNEKIKTASPNLRTSEPEPEPEPPPPFPMNKNASESGNLRTLSPSHKPRNFRISEPRNFRRFRFGFWHGCGTYCNKLFIGSILPDAYILRLSHNVLVGKLGRFSCSRI